MNRKKFFDAAARWDVETVSAGLREERALARAVDERGRTALHHCARTDGAKEGRDPADSLRVAEALLRAGANPDAAHDIPGEGGSFRATPLWYAVAWGRNPDLVRSLVKAGADPRSCLFMCIAAGDLEMAKVLVAAGAPLDEKVDGETPLACARRLKKPGFFRLLGGR